MFANSSFMQTQDLLAKGLNALTLRWQVITDNIANVDTPNFKRSEVTFESQLQRALTQNDKPEFQARMTKKNHIPFHQPMKWQEVQPRVHMEYNSEMRNDKNNVDIEKEMTDSAVTQMQYSSVASIVHRNYRLMGNLLR